MTDHPLDIECRETIASRLEELSAPVLLPPVKVDEIGLGNIFKANFRLGLNNLDNAVFTMTMWAMEFWREKAKRAHKTEDEKNEIANAVAKNTKARWAKNKKGWSIELLAKLAALEALESAEGKDSR